MSRRETRKNQSVHDLQHISAQAITELRRMIASRTRVPAANVSSTIQQSATVFKAVSSPSKLPQGLPCGFCFSAGMLGGRMS
jgi:hypothetical protein